MVSGFSDFADACEDFADDLEEARQDLHDEMDEGVRDTAEEMVGNMKQNVNSDSGDLADSISFNEVPDSRHDVEYRLGPEADYAYWVEYGTGVHGPTGESYTILPDGLSESQLAEARTAAREASKGKEGEAAQQAAMDVMQDLAEQYGALDTGGENPVLKVEHPGSEGQFYFKETVDDAIVNQLLTRNLREALDKTFKPVATH